MSQSNIIAILPQVSKYVTAATTSLLQSNIIAILPQVSKYATAATTSLLQFNDNEPTKIIFHTILKGN